MYLKHWYPPENRFAEIIALYAGGMSVLALAKKFRSSRRIITSVLGKTRTVLRTASEQERIKWSTWTHKRRMQQVAAAHAACRGKMIKLSVRKARAQQRYELQISIGKREIEFAKLLDAARIEYRQQVPCGVYNLDFALTRYRVAVEIVMGAGNSRFTPAYKRKRLKCVLNSWHLFEVRNTAVTRRIKFSPAVVEKLIAFAKVTRLDKSSPGQHRVIRPDGESLGTCPKKYGRTAKSGTYHFVHRTVGSDGRPL